MKIRSITSTIALTALLLPNVGTAASAYPYYGNFACASFLNAAGEKITAARFEGKNAVADQKNLISKLDAAYSKLIVNPPKYEDAITKLENISQTAYELSSADKPKLDSAAATAIMDAAGSAITECLVNYLR